MSWEVSSMPSKRSSFNWTLFKKDLSRFWPLWGGVTLAGCLIPLYLLLELMSHTGPIKDLSLDFVRLLYGAVTAFAPAFIMCYAILCAMVVWSYLCSARSVGMMHALPVDRRCLYLTGTMAGLTMLVIPFAVVGGLLCLVMACFGGFAPLAVLETVAAVLLMTLLFFGLATVCAMITGNIFAIPVLYLLINFLAPLLDALVGSLTSLFLMGVEGSGTGLTFLSPVMAIYENFTYTAEYDNMTGEWAELRLEGMAVVAVCGLLGAALLPAAAERERRGRGGLPLPPPRVPLRPGPPQRPVPGPAALRHAVGVRVPEGPVRGRGPHGGLPGPGGDRGLLRGLHAPGEEPPGVPGELARGADGVRRGGDPLLPGQRGLLRGGSLGAGEG